MKNIRIIKHIGALIALSVACVFFTAGTPAKANIVPTFWTVLSNDTLEVPATINGNARSNTQINISASGFITGLASAPAFTPNPPINVGSYVIDPNPVPLPTLAEALAAVGSYTTINGNVSAADAQLLAAGTYYVIGNVQLSGLLANDLTFVVDGNFGSDAATVLTSFSQGLAVYSTQNAIIGGTINGQIIAENVDINTGAIVNQPPSTPDSGMTVTLLGMSAVGLELLRRRLKS
jgi:cytoskeletal protein CcmA (bactofilin family)